MKRINQTIDFKSDVATVYNTLTALDDCSWRSDLSKVKKISADEYVEYDRKNHETKITITDRRDNIQFEYNVVNNNYEGHWIFQFAPLDDGGCRLFLTFDFEPRSIFGKFSRVEKFETRFIEDLKKELRE